jgi:hypothetical protein
MAEHPELWTEKTPERDLFGRTPAFGAAREAARRAQEPPPADATADALEAGRERGPFMTYLCLPWSYGDRTPRDRWHGLQCRWGRHEMGGGHTMQLGGTDVFIERRCRWCAAGA